MSTSPALVDGGLALDVSPLGQPYLDEDPASPIALDVATRIRAAFADGPPAGLLHLGTSEIGVALPPSLSFFRDFARLFLARACGTPDLEQIRERIEVACPGEELAALIDGAPPMAGAEYLTPSALEALWSGLGVAFRSALAASEGTVEQWLQARNPAWNLVGRVCFHLAENRADEARPFAFIATYASHLSSEASGARAQHLPLEQALHQYAGARNRAALLSLLGPVEKAAGRSTLGRELLDSGELFHALAWTPAEAHRFLREIPCFEEAGVVVRVPDWWRARRAARVEVAVTVGTRPPSQLGLDALLDFEVNLTAFGEPLSEAEWQALREAADGLVLLRGRWVELDRDKLDEVLAHWRSVERSAKRDGLSFIDGMRLLSGAPRRRGESAIEHEVEWSHIGAGRWLGEVLAGLRGPDALAAADPGDALHATLRPYQRTGVAWLRFLHRLGLGACLADDMGLGKTIQVLGLLLLLQREARDRPNLLVVPASLIANWQSEIDRFAPSLRTLVAHPSAIPARELAALPPSRLSGIDLVITTYGSAHRLAWLGQTLWNLVILDEAQAIKNPAAKQTRAVKAFDSRGRIALTGTPVENRLSDLWSLFDFINPGLLGTATEFTALTRRLTDGETPNFAPLRNLVRPYILRRLKSDRSIIADLPDKTELRAFCSLTGRQAALYQQSVEALATLLRTVEGIQRRGSVLAFLLRFKQICNHPSQWLGDGGWSPGESGKFARLHEIAESIAVKQEKALVFTQFRELTGPLAAFLAGVFGRPGLLLHGSTPVKERRALVERFQSDERIPFFVLSVKAGGTGLNLTAASHVIHFDRWWNPAVEDQATDRAFRIGQRRNVLVHKFICRGTVEEKIDALIESKKGLSRELLGGGGGEALLTELSDRELIELVSLDARSALEEA